MTPAKTEQFLTVVERQGPKTWRWQLKSLNLTPRVGDDGAVGFIRNGRLMSDVAYIEPVRILDELGKDVTPDDARWSVAESGGRWFLELALDDAKLPLPYVIDPAIASRAVGVSTPATPQHVAEVSRSRPGSSTGDLMIAQLTVRGGTDDRRHHCAVRAATGTWTSIDRQDSTTVVAQQIFQLSATAADVAAANYTFSFRTGACPAGGATSSKVLGRDRRLHRRRQPGEPDQHQRRPGQCLERDRHRAERHDDGREHPAADARRCGDRHRQRQRQLDWAHERALGHVLDEQRRRDPDVDAASATKPSPRSARQERAPERTRSPPSTSARPSRSPRSPPTAPGR